MQELMVDFITSLDGYAAAEGWPGFWGLQGPEYLAWLGEQGVTEVFIDLNWDPIIGDPARFIDARPVFRQFFCPGCGRLIENEVALEGEPVLRPSQKKPTPRRR